jgi:hypothetical protein
VHARPCKVCLRFAMFELALRDRAVCTVLVFTRAGGDLAAIPRLPLRRKRLLRHKDLPTHAASLSPDPERLLMAQLPAVLPLRGRLRIEQRHGLIGQQLATSDLQPLAPAVPESGPEVQHQPAVADLRIPWRQRRAVPVATTHAASGAQPRWRCRSSAQPLQRWVRCSPWAISP